MGEPGWVDKSTYRLVAIRGATTVEADETEAIVAATESLLAEILAANEVAASDIVSILFTATPDLTAAFPAVAARRLGLSDVALMCAQEMAVPDAPERCVRVLVHLYSERDYASLVHVYRGAAASLRADLQARSGEA